MAIINGTEGDDTDLLGTELDDEIFGLGGADFLSGLAGADQLFGGEGDDELVGGAGDDLLDGGDGNNDAIRYQDEGGGSGVIVDLLAGTATDTFGDTDTIVGIERVIGTNRNDGLLGDGNNNDLFGGGGNDVLHGRGGDDQLSGGNGSDIIRGGSGIDTVRYNREDGPLGVTVDLAAGTATDSFGQTDTLVEIENVRGTDHADTLTGDSDANVLQGDRGADVLNGGAGNDRLDGGNGADTLSAGAGIDVLNGGLGEDTFIFALGDGQNVIEDFESGTDVIVLEGVPAGFTVYNLLPFVSQQGNDVVAEAFGSSVTLENTALADLAPEDVILL